MKVRWPARAALIVSFLWHASAHADPVDDIVLAEIKRQNAPAIGIAVVKNGRTLKEKGYGFANIELGVRADSKTFFQTASAGKQFTAALVMLLVNDGKLKLDESISTYLQDAPSEWQQITIRHLLTHTSGLPHTDEAIDLRKDYTEDELATSAFKLPLKSAAGDAFSYSNVGYQLLGIICSKIGGRFYGDQARDRLFAPSGMQAHVMSERKITRGRAAGYDREDGIFLNQSWVSPTLNTTADGSYYASAQDMALWAVILDSTTLLSQATKDVMWTPTKLNNGTQWDWGFGWRLFYDPGHRSVRHRGDWQGFTSHILHFPDDRLTISVLMNRSNAQPHVIADKIAAYYIPALRKPSAPPPSAATFRNTKMYVRRNMTDSKGGIPFELVEPNIFLARLTLAEGMQGFSILSDDGKVIDFGAPVGEAITKLDKPKQLEFQGESLWIEITKSSAYELRLNVKNPRSPVLTVSPAASGGS
jgi:CubicO group peptidase (beta-lactamase class C family)